MYCGENLVSEWWCDHRDSVCQPRPSLPPCWDMNCWPCCDTLKVSSKLKTHLTTTTGTQTVLSFLCPAPLLFFFCPFHASLRPKKTHQYFLSPCSVRSLTFSGISLWLCNKAFMHKGPLKMFSRTQKSIWWNPLMEEQWSAVRSKWGQRKHIGPRSSHWTLGSFLFLSQPGRGICNVVETDEPHGFRWEDKQEIWEKHSGRLELFFWGMCLFTSFITYFNMKHPGNSTGEESYICIPRHSLSISPPPPPSSSSSSSAAGSSPNNLTALSPASSPAGQEEEVDESLHLQTVSAL